MSRTFRTIVASAVAVTSLVYGLSLMAVAGGPASPPTTSESASQQFVLMP